MDFGTPTSSKLKMGSAVMTDRALKSTRLPMRLPRMRPSLPLMRCAMVLSKRPDRCVSWIPELPLSKKLATRACSKRSAASTMWLGSPRAMYPSRVRFTFTTLHSTSVKSSWLSAPSCKTVGRTWGGGTGRTLMTSQSGRTHLGSNPSTSASWSLMRLSTRNARSADKFCFGLDPVSFQPGSSGWNSAITSIFPSLRYLGRKAPHPVCRPFAVPIPVPASKAS
mmetsp:Transcript_65534/g.131836  ORF Transcript_65534/g.131836 Transcript_65534/m.131836 type:complete len:223 (-) Transcript_65534:699-1367(-)